MRALILVVGASLSLAACGGGGETANNDANLMTDNMMMDQNMTMDANMMDPNMSGNMGGMDGNMSTNMATENNMMAQDANTNAPDTNLANGM